MGTNNLTKLLLAYVLLATIIFAACETKTNNGPKKVAVIVSTLNNPWFVFLAQNAEARAKELGYETKIFDSQNNTALESDHFENAIASGFSAILLNPTDADGSIANVVKAKAANVPVFCMDREVNSDAATSQILSDNYSGSVSIGKYFVQELNKKGTYVELLGLVGDNNTWNRSKGFHEVVDVYPGLKMVAQQSADFDRNKAMDVLESILQANPNINAVFCGNDAMAMGAYQALAAAGKVKGVKVFGFDGADDVIKAIGDKKIAATGMQFPKVMAITAANFADEYFKGRRDFPKKIPVAVELVTGDNLKFYAALRQKRLKLMRKILKNIALLLLVAFLVYNSVYFTSVKDMKAKVEGFDATGYAQRFYQNQLLPLSDSAINITDLINLLKSSKDTAFNQYGNALSIGAIKYFLVKGEGTVTGVNENAVAIQLPADADTRFKIATELVFGNAIRDASGKISLTEFSNLSDVNGISMELNKIVRANVLPPFKAAVKEGSKIRFYGAVELNKERLNLDEMEILPIQLQVVNQ